MFWNGWESLGRVLLVGTLAYVSLVVVLRVTGKRTLSKMNAFDFVVTVALGSTLATMLLNRNISLAEGVLAFALLTGLQFIVAWIYVRQHAFKRWVSAEPRMLFWRGEFLRDAMRKERIREDEMLAAIREQGLGGVDQVEAIILETEGTLSVVQRARIGDGAALPAASLRQRHGAAG